MKRWTLRILILLILGVVTTVGVAWGLAAAVDMTWMEPQSVAFRLPPAGTQTRRVEYQHFFNTTGATRVVWVEVVVFGMPTFATYVETPYTSTSRRLDSPNARALQWCFRDDMPPDPLMHVSDARGWPMLALSGGLDLAPSGGGSRDVTRTYWTIAVMKPDQMSWLYPNVDCMRRFIPARPIFPGFLVNTLFYAAMWFGIFFGVAALRRFVRKKRGRCVKCSYDLRGQFDMGCPECGWGRERLSCDQP